MPSFSLKRQTGKVYDFELSPFCVPAGNPLSLEGFPEFWVRAISCQSTQSSDALPRWQLHRLFALFFFCDSLFIVDINDLTTNHQPGTHSTFYSTVYTKGVQNQREDDHNSFGNSDKSLNRRCK